MKQFCIDLEGVMLPDAIAALVDAWSEAQIANEADCDSEWRTRIKNEIRKKHGKGWVLRGVGVSKFRPNGVAQLIHRKPDNTKSTAVLPYEFKKENEIKILKCVLHLCEQVAMCDNNVSLQEAAKVVLPQYEGV